MKLKSLIFAVALLLHALPSHAQINAVANYSVENQLVAGTLGDVVFSVTDNGAPLKNISGRLLDENGNVAATFNSDEYGQGWFMFVPGQRQYHVEWDVDGQQFITDFLKVKDSGYVWSIDNVSRATYIPLDPKRPNKYTFKKEDYTPLELEQKSKMNHAITKYIKEYNDIPDDDFSDIHRLTLTGFVSPVDCHNITTDYIPLADRLQGKNKLQKDYISIIDRPLQIPEDIKVWVERPKEMDGDSLWVEVYHGDRRMDSDVVDMRKANIACLRFLLNELPQGDLEIRLLDKEHHIMAIRDVKASHYMRNKSYKDARKTDIDCRLRKGTVYPLIASNDKYEPIADDGLMVCFTPENGSIVTGASTQIAFAAVNGKGDEVLIDGKIYSPSDSVVTSFSSWTENGGSFFMQPKETGKYYAIINYDGKRYKAELPEVVESGLTVGVDCLSQIYAVDDTKEWKDWLDFYAGFWCDGDLKMVPTKLDSAFDRIGRLKGFSSSWWVFELMNSQPKLKGKYRPYIETDSLASYYSERLRGEDDIKIRIVNKNSSVADSLSVALIDDSGNEYDSQTVSLDIPEVWLRFPIDEKTPQGYLNCVFKNAATSEKICSRRIHTAHYNAQHYYTAARVRDINNILQARRYIPATPL